LLGRQIAAAGTTLFGEVFHGRIQRSQHRDTTQYPALSTLLYEACRDKPRQMMRQGRRRDAQRLLQITDATTLGSTAHQAAEHRQARGVSQLGESTGGKQIVHGRKIMLELFRLF
jgi:hypothetical protein